MPDGTWRLLTNTLKMRTPEGRWETLRDEVAAIEAEYTRGDSMGIAESCYGRLAVMKVLEKMKRIEDSCKEQTGTEWADGLRFTTK